MKGNAAEVLRRLPDYLILSLRPADEPGLGPSDSDRRAYPFIADLVADPEFHELYELDSLPLGDGRWVDLYRRRALTDAAVP